MEDRMPDNSDNLPFLPKNRHSPEAEQRLLSLLEDPPADHEAVRAYIAGIQANPVDARSLMHLEDLCERHEELSTAIPGLDDTVKKCVLLVQRRQGSGMGEMRLVRVRG
jgi:hypothetical protein